MNDIISTIKNGSSRDRLAVIADIFGIGGISFAAVVGGLASLPSTVRVPDLVGMICYSLLFLALALCSMALFAIIAQWMWNRFAPRPFLRTMAVSASTCTFLAIFIASAFHYYLRVMSPLRVVVS